MIAIKLTKEKVEYLRYNHPDPLIQKRLECIWLKHLGYRNNQIATIANLHHDTVTSYIKLYKQGGSLELDKKHYRKNTSQLTIHTSSILEDFAKNPPQTINQACARIESLTGIKRKPTQVGRFMKKIGLKRLKCGYIPGKADREAQEKFLETSLRPELEQAKEEKKSCFVYG